MKKQRTAQLHLRVWLTFCLSSALLAFFGLFPAEAAPKDPASKSQSHSKMPADVPIQDRVVVPASIHGAIRLDQRWRFHAGDDPAWASPDFDDSAWDTIDLLSPLASQGQEIYSGYGWYRLRLLPVPLPDSGKLALSLLVVPHSVGQMQVLVNGAPVGHTQGMPELQGSYGATADPISYESGPFVVRVSNALADGSVVVAIRTWADTPISHGLVEYVQMGDSDSVAETLSLEKVRQWDQRVFAGLLVSFLFLSVSVLGATLYLAQRNHSEYLWLSLLCLSVALTDAIYTAFSMALMPLHVFRILDLWSGRVFMAITLEFVLRFTASGNRKTVRAVQIAVLILPCLWFLPWPMIYQVSSITAELVFLSLISILLFRSWRRGRPDAGVMLVPFFLAAATDSSNILLDYAASKHWMSDRFASRSFHLGPIDFTPTIVAYLIFLSSLVAVILYRFVRVSQEEQRSTAELDAARSVQALLIPTKLPSTVHFVLEGAYLPARGVGGDFFQALPLKDDSMLIVVGDVSGKGLQAAMNASTLVGALRNELAHDPATILSHLNQVLIGATSGASAAPVAGFTTCLCARIYPDGVMQIANAGHLSPYRDGRELDLIPSLPLGLLPDIEFLQSTFHLKPGDRLTFLSDGVVEAANPKGELFGFERTQQVSNEPARYIAQTAQRFGQTDDITVVTLYFAAASHARPERQPVHAH